MLSLSVDIWRPVVSGASQSLTAQVQALFAGGKVGGMWDMGDTSTLYQTADGTTPASSASNPVGMVLDKSLGAMNALGTNLVTNGDFSGATSFFSDSISSGTAAIVAGQLEVTASGTAYSGVAAPFSFQTPGWYYVEATLVSGTGRFTIEFFGVEGVLTNIDRTGPYTYRGFVKLRDSDGYFRPILRSASSGAVTVWDNISFRRIPGNHATQSTAGSRPLYQVVSSYGCAQFDGTDDLLNFPAINFSATDKATLVASVTLTGSTNNGLVSFGTATAGGFHGGYYSAVAAWATTVRGDTGVSIMQVTRASMPAIPHTRVVTFEYDLAGASAADESKIRLNGVSVPNQVVTLGPAGGGNLQNGAGVIGQSQGVFCFAGNINRFALVGGALTVGERALLEAWAAEGSGITL